MPTIAAVVADLLARPRPILCLDTCDLLDIIQCVAEGKARRPEHVRRLILHISAFPGRRVFVSANKADFWEAKNKSDIHPDLLPQLAAVGLEFFGSLEAALGSLGI